MYCCTILQKVYYLLTDFLGVREFDLGVVDRDLDSCDLDFLPPSLLLELLLLDCDDDELLRLSLDAVSYTHLDVYKRQRDVPTGSIHGPDENDEKSLLNIA